MAILLEGFSYVCLTAHWPSHSPSHLHPQASTTLANTRNTKYDKALAHIAGAEAVVVVVGFASGLLLIALK